MARLATTPATILNEGQAKAIPLRWFTGDHGHTVFGGHEHLNLAHWCENGPYACKIALRWLAIEAHSLCHRAFAGWITAGRVTPLGG
ncbi:hypothetical protein [Nocardia sp. NPDC051570]|uniref:hypothetical protein n=1 Tax=Nocardia sp. NPDC051570 TaxID=3364324 RepID=UPI0037B1C511